MGPVDRLGYFLLGAGVGLGLTLFCLFLAGNPLILIACWGVTVVGWILGRSERKAPGRISPLSSLYEETAQHREKDKDGPRPDLAGGSDDCQSTAIRQANQGNTSAPSPGP